MHASVTQNIVFYKTLNLLQTWSIFIILFLNTDFVLFMQLCIYGMDLVGVRVEHSPSVKPRNMSWLIDHIGEKFDIFLYSQHRSSICYYTSLVFSASLLILLILFTQVCFPFLLQRLSSMSLSSFFPIPF